MTTTNLDPPRNDANTDAQGELDFTRQLNVTHERRGRPARARRNDPETAKKAAKTCNTDTIDAGILAYLTPLYPEGRTIFEISAALNTTSFTPRPIAATSVSPRLRPMLRAGILEEHGKRTNPTGKEAIAWRITR